MKAQIPPIVKTTFDFKLSLDLPESKKWDDAPIFTTKVHVSNTDKKPAAEFAELWAQYFSSQYKCEVWYKARNDSLSRVLAPEKLKK